MSASLRDLNRRVDALVTPGIDAAALIRQGEARLRRRRLTAVLGSAAAVVVVIALALTVAAGLDGPVKRSDGPVDRPTSSPEAPLPRPVRKIVYSDDLVFDKNSREALSRVGTIHVGDREVEIDQTLHTVRAWALQVTDAGAVYAKDDQSVWFTDGGTPRRIAEQACVGTAQSSGFATGNAGPYAVWFDCSPALPGTDLVVFDTVSGHEVARHSIPSCRVSKPLRFGLGYKCVPRDVVGEHVYFDLNGRGFVFDVPSGRVTPASPTMYGDDLRAHSRALVIGDSWQTGTLVDGLTFSVKGSRLVPQFNENSEQGPTRAFDAATGQPVQLRLPGGYHPDPASIADAGTDSFTFFEWLDDDTVALSQGVENTVGDLIVCHLSDGRCRLAVKAGPPDKHRIVVGRWLPG
jgi:hypothetical protein